MKVEDTAATRYADYRGVLRGRWKIIVAGLLVGLLAGLVFAFFRPAVYTSAVSVLVLPVDTSGTGSGSSGAGGTDDPSGSAGSTAINLDTEAQLVTSTAVVDNARTRMNSSLSRTELAERVSVEVSPNSSVLDIEYHGDSPEEAARGAHYFALAYLSNRESVAQSAIDDQVKRLKKQIDDLSKKLQTVSGRVATLPSNSADGQYAVAQQGVLTNQLNALNEPLSQLTSSDVTPGRVLTDASLASGPDQPSPPVFPITGAALGLVAGIAFAILRDRSDHSVRSARDVGELLRPIPVLADLQLDSSPRTWHEVFDSHSSATQEIRQLQQAVVTAADERPPRILVTGAFPGPATAVVAANLALSIARTDRTVAYVGADLFSPAGAQLLVTRRSPGLAEILLEGYAVDDVLQTSPLTDRIHVVAPGGDAARADDRLQLEQVRDLLVELSRRFDHVVVEAPPASSEASTQIWASQIDVAVLVVERHRAQREAVVGAVGKLERVGCRTVGTAVLTPHPKDTARTGAPVGAASAATAVTAGGEPDDAERPAPLRRSRPGPYQDPAQRDRQQDADGRQAQDDSVSYVVSGYGAGDTGDRDGDGLDDELDDGPGDGPGDRVAASTNGTGGTDDLHHETPGATSGGASGATSGATSGGASGDAAVPDTVVDPDDDPGADPTADPTAGDGSAATDEGSSADEKETRRHGFFASGSRGRSRR